VPNRTAVPWAAWSGGWQPAHGRDVATEWSLRLFPTQAILTLTLQLYKHEYIKSSFPHSSFTQVQSRCKVRVVLIWNSKRSVSKGEEKQHCYPIRHNFIQQYCSWMKSDLCSIFQRRSKSRASTMPRTSLFSTQVILWFHDPTKQAGLSLGIYPAQNLFSDI